MQSNLVAVTLCLKLTMDRKLQPAKVRPHYKTQMTCQERRGDEDSQISSLGRGNEARAEIQVERHRCSWRIDDKCNPSCAQTRLARQLGSGSDTVDTMCAMFKSPVRWKPSTKVKHIPMDTELTKELSRPQG